MQQWCEDDKPATKILLKGRNALSDSELLSIIIGNEGSRNRSSPDLARVILHHANDNLAEIAKLSVSDLITTGNITLAQANKGNHCF